MKDIKLSSKSAAGVDVLCETPSCSSLDVLPHVSSASLASAQSFSSSIARCTDFSTHIQPLVCVTCAELQANKVVFLGAACVASAKCKTQEIFLCSTV